MSTTLNFRYLVDAPEWRMASQVLYGTAASSGTSGIVLATDLRSRDYQSPLSFFQSSSANIAFYDYKRDAYSLFNASYSAGGSFVAGATAVFCPTFSPMGTIAAGATTTSFTLTTALPASVVINQLANRGDGLGYIVRVIGNAAGSSGKIEERRVIANTSGTNPTIYLDKALSFTPASGDRYEFLSGSVLFLNTGALAANQFRRYDILTQSYSSLSTTNLIATVPTTAQNWLIPLDEQYVPTDRNPGEGYVVGTATYDTSGDFSKKCLTATNSAAGTITGQAASGDAAVSANQFRNFQIRVVEDTAIPTAVGQRRRITSHTAGASPVYTLASNWTVTPSTTAKFVIENDTDRLIGLMGGTTTTYNYFISNLGNTAATANTWDTTSWGARAFAMTAFGNMSYYMFATPYNGNVGGNEMIGRIISFRGNTTTYDELNITGGATGTWSAITPANIVGFPSIADGFDAQANVHMAYNPYSQSGRCLYFYPGGNSSSVSQQRPYVIYDAYSRTYRKIAGPKIGSGTTTAPNMVFGAFYCYQDGDTKIPFYHTVRPGNFIDSIQLMITE